MSQDTVIFLHISKTGGTTLRSILQNQYSQEQIYDLDPSYFVSDSKSYDRVFVERFLNLKNMSDEAKNLYRCFFNSRAYGLHEFLPQSVQYVTMLRDPIDHYISSYYFAVNKSGHIHHEALVKNNLTLDTYIDHFPADNLQTRRISGCDPLDSKVDKQHPITDKELEVAKHHLEHDIAVFGLLEHYDASLLMMQQHFAWKDVRYSPKNVAPKRKAVDALSPETCVRLGEMMKYDIELYDFANTIFQQRLEQQGQQFQLGLEKFRKRNESYRRWRKSKSYLRKTMEVLIRSSKRILR